MKVLVLILLSLPAFPQTAGLSPMFRQQWFTNTGAMARLYPAAIGTSSSGNF